MEMYHKELVPWLDEKMVDKSAPAYLTNMLKLKRAFCTGKSKRILLYPGNQQSSTVSWEQQNLTVS